MAILLNIETATTVCSIALSRDGKLLAIKESDEARSHAESITVFIEEVVSQAGFTLNDIDAVAVSKGPGSYTGLRIGVSTAKGLCYSLEKPLIAINTLQSMGYYLSKSELVKTIVSNGADQTEFLICPMIDARRMEVYSGFYDLNNTCIRETSADIIDETSYSSILEKYKVIFCGDGAAKCKPVFEKHPHAIFLDAVFPSAVYMIELAEAAYNKNDFVDVAYFEPFYLKDFFTPAPKSKG